VAEIAEIASDGGQAFYGLLSDLKRQMLLGALAGLYHQWDKELRDFVEHELRHDLESKAAAKIAWDSNVGNVFGRLTEFGWDCRSAAFFPGIDACRLVVNVYKHGKGPSLDELGTRFPEYLDNGFTRGTPWHLAPGYLDHEWLSISEPQFDEIGNATPAVLGGIPGAVLSRFRALDARLADEAQATYRGAAGAGWWQVMTESCP
jgi:hypothetical protein